MCGLFGFAMTDPEAIASRLKQGRAALESLSHRGPDQAGEYVSGSVYLGHRRLSIMDLSESGRQPMLSADEGVAITVNGEIYNYRALKEQLASKYRFASHSDSEVVLHGYAEWGIAGLVERLEGMYAAVICDFKQRKIFLLRDRVGIKPLYHCFVEGRFVWASELKAIVTFVGRDKLSVDSTALFDFLTYRYVPSPKTLYRDVCKLEPAHYLEYSMDSAHSRAVEYWQLGTQDSEQCSWRDAPDRIAAAVKSSVIEQMMSDVPVGFFLSGGIDSSVVVTAATQAGVNARTFSIGFDDRKHDETAFAQLLAQSLGVAHEIRRLSALEAVDLVSWMQQTFDEPFADTSALATFKLAEFARQAVTVALSGDGGDELFGGYAWYGRYRYFSPLSRVFSAFLPGSLRQAAFVRNPVNLLQKVRNRALVVAQKDPLALFQSLVPGLSAGERNRYRAALEIPGDYDALWSLRRFYRPELGALKSLQYLDLKTFLPDDVLTKVDRTTMAVSLEVRVPLLSTALIELAFALPEQFHYSGGRLKAGLKAAFAECVPSAILNRPKKGFGLPTHAWRREMFGSYATFSEAMLVQGYGVSP